MNNVFLGSKYCIFGSVCHEAKWFQGSVYRRGQFAQKDLLAAKDLDELKVVFKK